MHFLNPNHLYGATKNSLAGLAHACRSEQAFRHEIVVFVLLCLVLAGTGKGFDAWLLVLGAWIAVMVVELLNSAVEEAFDLISTQWHPRIKAGKDMASAAILLTMAVNAVIWIRVFLL